MMKNSRHEKSWWNRRQVPDGVVLLGPIMRPASSPACGAGTSADPGASPINGAADASWLQEVQTSATG
jgi:hypothetical protein